MTMDNIDAVRTVVAEVLGLDPAVLTEDSGMDVTEGWDSLRHLMIIMEVEQQCGHRFAVEDLAEAKTIATIAARLPRRPSMLV